MQGTEEKGKKKTHMRISGICDLHQFEKHCPTFLF